MSAYGSADPLRRYHDKYVTNGLVRENVFLKRRAEEAELPMFVASAGKLPQPFWRGHEAEIEAYWKAWELAFGHLRKATADNGFVADFIDTAFNNDLFMYDSSFITMFGHYGRRAFDFQRNLDNFYAKQHPDGFICRQIRQSDGTDVFHRFDPSSTGPNVMPWAEWEYFNVTSDIGRLAEVFPVLVAYHRWLKAYRTWPDGSYWANGWSGAADNLPRIPGNGNKEIDYFHHGHLVWCDGCIFQAFAARVLSAMAGILDREREIDDIAAEARELTDYINNKSWDEQTAYYYDMLPDGKLNGVKNIGAYWALLAGAVPPERLDRFVGHLSDPRAFNRTHRVPSLAADHPAFNPAGDYWVGAVWAPTNYMVLRGLSRSGYEPLAKEIAMNHLTRVVEVYKQTGTIWEDYAPDAVAPGKPAKPDFVGWGGLTPITVLLEYVFGLKPDSRQSRLVWDIGLLEDHGVSRYPFGKDGMLDLQCASRASVGEKPRISVKTNVSIELDLIWSAGRETLRFGPDSPADGDEIIDSKY